ncbi:MAG: hypothetical protein ABW252_12750 [Polyangiales bacterium]
MLRSTQRPEFGADEYCPAAHAVQTWSADMLPSDAMYVPGWQVVHGAQLVAFKVALNCPVSHDAQLRSATVLPWLVTNCPDAQSRLS